jgi:hypothetical protein
MKLEELRQKLLAVARANPPADKVPYAFEKRITALLSSLPVPDLWTLWARALWRASVPCVAVMLVLGAVTLAGSHRGTAANGKPAAEELSLDFEQTMLAAVDQSGGNW